MRDLSLANSSSASDASLRTTASGHRILSVDQFVLEEELGTGSFGTVYRARDLVLDRTCAVKKIDMDETSDDIEEIQREISILAECHDPRITRYFGSFVNGYKLWIIMEYLGGGSCLDLIKVSRGLPESAIAWIIAELLRGLDYLHTNGKIHRDIKAANILVSEDGAVKIADFGVATQLSNNLSRRNTFVGTPFWMAPEVINQEDYTYSADIWSLGITAMELANGEPPLSHLHPMKVIFYIPRNPPPMPSSAFSREFRDFVGQCLRKSPAERSSISSLLKHRFLAKASRRDLTKLVDKRLAMKVTKSSTPIPATMSSSSNFDSSADDDDDWDFDTVKPESAPTSSGSSGSSLNASATQNKASVLSPIPSPQPGQKERRKTDTIKTIQETMRDRRGPLLRIFSHAAQKFDDQTLAEIADVLSIEPLTMESETYLVKKIGRVAVDKLDIKPKDNHKRLDPVEDILLTKWLAEAQKRHK